MRQSESAASVRPKSLVAHPWAAPLLVIAAVGVYAVAVVNAARRIGQGMGDFRHFYYAAGAMASGQDPYTSWHHGYIYPPLLAFLLMPISALPVGAAAAVMLCVNSAALIVGAGAAGWACARAVGHPQRGRLALAASAVAALVLADKVKSELQMWQTNALVLGALAGAMCWKSRRPCLSGGLLGFAFNIKFLPLIWAPYLAVRRRWVLLCAFVASAAVLGVLPAVRTGLAVNAHQLGRAYAGVLELVGVHTGSGVRPRNALDAEFSLSITSAVGRALDGMPAWAAVIVAGAICGVIAAVVGRMYRAAGVPLWRDRAAHRQPPLLSAAEWCGLIVAALCFSPQTNTRHLVLLIIPASLAGALFLSTRDRAIRATLLAALIILAAGTSLPPGGPRYGRAIRIWRDIAGPCWTTLAFYLLTLRSVLRTLERAPGAVPIGSGFRSAHLSKP